MMPSIDKDIVQLKTSYGAGGVVTYKAKHIFSILFSTLIIGRLFKSNDNACPQKKDCDQK